MKVGILGGGQLGRMLLQAAANYTVETFVLENDANCPAAHLCHHFTCGNIRDFKTVYNFGKQLQALTIEIESVNVEALQALEREGVVIIPQPEVIQLLQNKINQKKFYTEEAIPTAPFIITQNAQEVTQHTQFLPAVHKAAEGGYDGKGVIVLETENDVQKAFNKPSVLERKIKIKKELSVIVAVSRHGEIVVYPVVEMVFHAHFNLLDYQICPAQIPNSVIWKAEAIAFKVAKQLKSPGIFAIEMFLDEEDNIWVNETAPRVHNSGHHTIEAHFCSQYDMLWRILLNYPLGNPAAIMPSAVVNILGSQGFEGKAYYKGLEEVLAMENVFVHLYGKETTKPGRKMGHVTILNNEISELHYKAHKIRETLQVRSVEK